MFASCKNLSLLWGCFTLSLMAAPTSVYAYEKGDIIFRLGYASVDPRENVDPVLVNNQLNLGGLGLKSQETPLLTTTVQLNKNWGVEVLLPLMALEIEVGGNGGALEGLAMGTADARPLSVVLQYYPFETSWAKPYLGFGVNYTFLSNTKVNQSAAMALGVDSIETLRVKNAYGFVFQAGVDIPVTERLSLNLSTSFLDLNTEASATFYVNGQLHSGETKLDLKKQPNISVIGLSYRW